MGGHYGSIHVRTVDREVVRTALETLNHEGARRFYLAPPIDGWVTVFPENNGQDQTVSEALAAKLPNETIIHCAVHDDDIFAYWFFEQGKLSDSYNSCPEYFGDENPPPRGGNAEAFATLLPRAKIGNLQSLLNEECYPFELDRQDRFAELLGLPNTATAYEYLRDGDTGRIRQRREFIHIPDLSAERSAKRAAQAKIRQEKKELQKKGILLVDREAENGTTKHFYKHLVWTPNPSEPEVIASWCDLFTADPSRTVWRRFAAPLWQESEIDSLPPAVPTFLQFSPSGGLFVQADGRRLVIWNTREMTTVLEREFKGRVSAISFAVDEKWLFVIVSNRPKTELHRIALEPGLKDHMTDDETVHFQRVIPHPGGKLLAVIDNFGLLLVVEIESLRALNQRWIRDDDSLLLNEHIKEVADQMSSKLLKLLGIREAEAHLKGTVRHFLPKETIRVGCFDSYGSWLFCGTSSGVRALQWQEALDGADMTPVSPVFGAEPEVAQHEAEGRRLDESRLIYAVVFDAGRQRVLYSGLEGKVSFLEISQRRAGTLLSVPGGDAFIDLALSSDRSALIATAHTFDFKTHKQKPQHFQIWNYRALCQSAGVEY